MLPKQIIFLDALISMPVPFSTQLPFSNEDKLEMSWLGKRTRYYGIEKEIGKGGRAIAYKGFVSDERGKALPKSPQIVLKIPNIKIDDKYTLDEIKDYLNRQSEECGREWQLTRERLRGCHYANVIFDLDTSRVSYLSELFSLPITAQRFLHDAVPLDIYLLETKQRDLPYRSMQGVPVDNWRGMTNPAEWIKLAKGIATGLADIHQRRVVHGDIWPPNVFIKIDENNNPLPIFIDFGEKLFQLSQRATRKSSVIMLTAPRNVMIPKAS